MGVLFIEFSIYSTSCLSTSVNQETLDMCHDGVLCVYRHISFDICIFLKEIFEEFNLILGVLGND